MYAIVNNNNMKWKELKKGYLKDIVPRDLNHKIRELQMKHQKP